MAGEEFEKILEKMQSEAPRQALIYQHATCIKDKAHCFEPRYDYGQPLGIEAQNIGSQVLLDFAEATKSKTYVYDICIKCGMIIGRKANGGEK